MKGEVFYEYLLVYIWYRVFGKCIYSFIVGMVFDMVK